MLTEPKSGEKIPKGWFSELYRHLFHGTLIKGDGKTTQVTCNNGVYQIHAKVSPRTSGCGKSEYNGMFKVVNASDDNAQKVRVVDGLALNKYCCGYGHRIDVDICNGGNNGGLFGISNSGDIVVTGSGADEENKYLYYVGQGWGAARNWLIINNINHYSEIGYVPYRHIIQLVAVIKLKNNKIAAIEQVLRDVINPINGCNCRYNDYRGTSRLDCTDGVTLYTNAYGQDGFYAYSSQIGDHGRAIKDISIFSFAPKVFTINDLALGENHIGLFVVNDGNKYVGDIGIGGGNMGVPHGRVYVAQNDLWGKYIYDIRQYRVDGSYGGYGGTIYL